MSIDSGVVPLYKPLGLTPLQAGQCFVAQRKLSPIRLGYAGRLDPLAEGVLLLLLGNGNSLQRELLKLPKTYHCTAVFGVTTDSYDLMGIAQATECTQSLPESLVQRVLTKFRGEYMQAYPPYSAVRVGGKPLFWWTRNNRLAEIEIPIRERYISEINLECVREISKKDLVELATHRINLVEGDFRQKEIIDSWEAEYSKLNNKLTTATFRCTSSSGTFIRGLVHDLGKRLGCPATTLHLTRTAVGPYTVDDCEYLNY